MKEKTHSTTQVKLPSKIRITHAGGVASFITSDLLNLFYTTKKRPCNLLHICIEFKRRHPTKICHWKFLVVGPKNYIYVIEIIGDSFFIGKNGLQFVIQSTTRSESPLVHVIRQKMSYQQQKFRTNNKNSRRSWRLKIK